MTGSPGLFMTLSARLDGSVAASFLQFENAATRAGANGARSLRQTEVAAEGVER